MITYQPGDLVVDYSFSRPSPAVLAGAEVRGVFRYLWDGNVPDAAPGDKIITRGEVRELTAVGLDLLLVHQRTTDRTTGTYELGQADADDAANAAGVLHYSGPLVAAVAFDARPEQVSAYLGGWAAQLERRGHWPGVYGGVRIADRWGAAGWFVWQTEAWSYGAVSAHTHVLQRIGLHHLAGLGLEETIDENDVLRSFAAGLPGIHTPNTPLPPPPGDPTVTTWLYRMPAGNYYLTKGFRTRRLFDDGTEAAFLIAQGLPVMEVADEWVEKAIIARAIPE